MQIKSNLRPFVKWVGGKRQLIPVIRQKIPNHFTTYIEPFVGGGALLFELQPEKAKINDANSELINVFKIIKDDPYCLLRSLKNHKNTSDYFYSMRALDRNVTYKGLSPVEKASRLIYLNKTCYNGLYRVNKSGQFNAPFGKYKNPKIVDEENILAISEYLNHADLEISNVDFEESLNAVEKGSFVYFDPPYDPSSLSSNFTNYMPEGFNIFDQVRLRDLCDKLSAKGIKFMVSNASTPFIQDLYKNYHIQIIQAKRSVNSNGDKRGFVNEVLITNYE